MTLSIGKTGMSRMSRIIATASPDIGQRLMSLYWLVRWCCGEGGVAVELGVRNGDSTRALLAACEDCGAILFSWDVEAVREHVVRRTLEFGIPWFKAEWHFTHERSVCGGAEWNRPSVGLVFVDTDHTYETTRAEISAWSPHVKVGGCMAFHDYWMSHEDAPRDGVKPAVDEFTNLHADSWRLETHDAWPGDTGLAIMWKIK